MHHFRLMLPATIFTNKKMLLQIFQLRIHNVNLLFHQHPKGALVDFDQVSVEANHEYNSLSCLRKLFV